MLIEADWISMLVGRDEIKVTSFKLTKHDFAAAYLDTSVWMQTWITAVDQNGHNLRLAWGPPVYLMDEKDIPRQQRADKCSIPFENIRAAVGVTT